MRYFLYHKRFIVGLVNKHSQNIGQYDFTGAIIILLYGTPFEQKCSIGPPL